MRKTKKLNVMGLIGKILITVACVLLSFFSFRIGRRKQEYEPHVDTLENEKRYSSKVMGHFCGFLFLLPLVSCWAPDKWLKDSHWDFCYVVLMLLIIVFLVIPKIRDEEDAEELKKRSNHGHDDYRSAR